MEKTLAERAFRGTGQRRTGPRHMRVRSHDGGDWDRQRPVQLEGGGAYVAPRVGMRGLVEEITDVRARWDDSPLKGFRFAVLLTKAHVEKTIRASPVPEKGGSVPLRSG